VCVGFAMLLWGGGHLPPSQETSSLAGMIFLSPKSQFHMVGFPVDRSVKVTVRGAYPLVGVPTKSALIDTSRTVTSCDLETVSEVYWFDAVSVTEYVPGFV